MKIAKEQLRQIIKENDINNVADIYALFKDSFKDMLRNCWKQNERHLLVMQKIARVIRKLKTKETDILPRR